MTSERRTVLAIMYMNIWVENPKIKRADALKKMQEQGVDIHSVSDISRITSSDEWRELMLAVMEESKASVIAEVKSGMVDVLKYQIAIAKGEIGDPRDSVGAAKNILDVYRDMTEGVSDVAVGGRTVQALQINNYYGKDDVGEIVEGAVVDFDADSIKKSYADRATFVDD